MIGEVRIYNRTLSPIEIHEIYRQTRVDYFSWYKRLWFWVSETWMILIGGKDE